MLSKIQPALAEGKMKYIDWSIAIMALVYGGYLLYNQEYNWFTYSVLAGGILSVALAVINPAKVMSLRIQAKMAKKNNNVQ